MEIIEVKLEATRECYEQMKYHTEENKKKVCRVYQKQNETKRNETKN